MELENVDFDLVEMTERTCEMMAVRAHEKGLELACRVMPGVPGRLKGDPVRLRQILLNLIGNAVKFTERGEVVVEVMTEDSGDRTVNGGDEEDKVTLLFKVRDTGIGIPEEKLGPIFDSFTQVDSSTTRQYGGTGLGLTISKRLVALMADGFGWRVK
jgi:signal transduction histidine kinase